VRIEKVSFLVSRSLLKKTRLGLENVHVFPDITCNLSYLEGKNKDDNADREEVGVFLARPICSNVSGYPKMIQDISEALSSICDMGFAIRLIPFNTDPHNNKEDDRIINDQVL
jgi:hypothetical protein